MQVLSHFSFDNYADYLQQIKGFLSQHKLLVGFCATTAVYGLWFFRRPRNLPPGPYGYPVIGSSHAFAGNLRATLKAYGDTYGDVYCLWFGSNRYFVILNSFDAVREAYVTQGTVFCDRPSGLEIPGFEIDDTIINSHYNETYKTSRKVIAQAFRSNIAHRLDSLFEEQMKQLEDHAMANGMKIDPMKLIAQMFANMILGVVFRKNYSLGDKELEELVHQVKQWFVVFGASFYSLFSPPIFNLFMKQKFQKTKISTEFLVRKAIGFINEIKENPTEKCEIKCVAEAYLEEEKSFNDQQVEATLTVLMPDAIHTASVACKWVLAYLLNYPQYQDAIFREIQEVKGSSVVMVVDRAKMPVTESFIMEVLRIVLVAPFGAPNNPVHNTTFKGYNIPKYVKVIPNYAAVHNDPKLFPEPECFKPERFIVDGRIGNTQGFMPFGLGRRMCVGEPIVRNEIFLLVSNLILKYRLLPPDGVLPGLEKVVDAGLMSVKPFTMYLEERKSLC